MALPFAISIAVLSVVQAALIALPSSPGGVLPPGLRSSWWAILPPASIAIVIAVVAADSGSARAISYLALVAVPPLAAWALVGPVRGGRPWFAVAVLPLFALAWAGRGSLLGEAAALALSALACVTLGWLLAAVAPPRWLKLGIYAMAAVDTCLVVADLLQAPNAVLDAARPAAGLPHLQVAVFGSATQGFGDLFVAATLGALLAREGRSQLQAAGLAVALALAFDLLFFAVRELPATVPIAVTLALLEWRGVKGRGTDDRSLASGAVRTPAL